jgi:hypothetical protein
MSEWWRDNWPIILIVAITLVFIGLTLPFIVVQARTEAACLRAGYPGASVDVFLNQYCVKRVDQTDVVVPLEDVKR